MNAARVANLDEVHQASVPSINQSIKRINQCIILLLSNMHQFKMHTLHAARCTLHVAFMSFVTLQQPQLAANLQPAQGREKELTRSWMGPGKGGASGFSIGHIDALHATTNNVQRFRCKVASYDAGIEIVLLPRLPHPRFPCPCPCPCICLTVSSLFVLLANFGKILQLLRLRQLQT